jgi:uroporphyrinogen decarboxylase
MDRLSDLQIRIAREAVKRGAHCIWLANDFAFNQGTFINPNLMWDMDFKYEKRIVDEVHKLGVPCALHACGCQTATLDMIVEAGFDALHPMEVKAGNDPLRIAAKYKDKLAFLGGLDARVLETHDKALIHRETAALIEGMKRLGARFVFASDHSISTNVDYADYQHALEAYHKHKAY